MKEMKLYRLFISLFLVLCSYTVYADGISGQIRLSGGFFPITATITGDISLTGNTLSINPTALIGVPYITLSSELLSPGTYTRTHNLSTGGSITRTGTIPSGTLGAYFVISSNSSEYQLFNAWDVSGDSQTFSNHAIPGDVWVGGQYNGRRVFYNFEIPPAFSEVTIQALGGGTYECSETSGATITLDSNPSTGGIAVLERVEWTVDGVLVNQGVSITEYFTLGSHTVEATAVTTIGDTATDTINVTVNDTVSPSIEVVFLNSEGNPVTSAISGEYTVQYDVNEICDLAPNVNGSASPVMTVLSGDVITVDQSSGDVILPTTAVRVSVRATDFSGNTATDFKILEIE